MMLIAKFCVVHDCTDIYIVVKVQNCGLILELFMNCMAPQMMRGVKEAPNKSTLDKMLITRQAVDAVVVAKELLPTVKL